MLISIGRKPLSTNCILQRKAKGCISAHANSFGGIIKYKYKYNTQLLSKVEQLKKPPIKSDIITVMTSKTCRY
jgi:hypothetical protein